MEFRLVYRGPLKAEGSGGGNTKQKHEIRKGFHKQLQELFRQHPQLRSQSTQPLIRVTTPPNMVSSPGPGVRQIFVAEGTLKNAPGAKPWIEHVADDHARFGYRFVPLISKVGGFACSLDILFLRRDNPGGLVLDGGDIDNRIKTLFDGLKMPSEKSHLKGYETPSNDENPFFCLLEDDSLITTVKITTDRLLTPLEADAGERPTDVHLIIQVTMQNLIAPFDNNRLI
jgi:hypothetical protein